MKKNIVLFPILILFLTACTAGEAIPQSLPTNPQPTQSPQLPEPSDTPAAPPTSTPTPKPTADLKLVLTPMTTVEYEVDYISLKTSDNVQLIAKQYGTGEPAVILAHQGTFGANQRDWQSFARMIAERGFSAVTLDFRGYGLSKGDLTAKNYLIRDMRSLIDYLRSEGYTRFVCIGASMGGTTCLRAAVEYDLIGLVVIGSLWTNGEPTNISMEELAALQIPKMFITTENDGFEVPESIQEMYAIAQEPKQLHIFPGDVHGTVMFNQPYGEQFTALLMAFVEWVR